VKSNNRNRAKTPVIRVTAGILAKEGRVLLAKRPNHNHLAGLWEFPGGKIENGESAVECLTRELAEELDISVDPREVAPFDLSFYEYGMKRILLIAMTITGFSGVPRPVEHAELKWVEIDELESMSLAPADVPVARRLVKRRFA